MLGEDTETFGEGKKMEIPDSFIFRGMLTEEFEMTPEDIKKEWNKLLKYDASQNKNSFCGNKLVYAFYWEELLNTRYKGGKTMMEIYEADPEKYWGRVCKMDRRKGKAPSARDAYELNKAITFFKPTTAKHLVERFTKPGARVFDPCAGWGGRLLGTLSCGREYIGCDTNPHIEHMAGAMVEKLDPVVSNFGIHNISCLDWNKGFDWADFAFTSPPYGNLEVYTNMTIFVDDDDYYKNFLIPMIMKCMRIVKPCCPVAINVSPQIYEKLVSVYDFPPAQEKIDFLQQMGQQSGKKKDYVYIWFRQYQGATITQ
mgnify:FL=1